MLNRIGFAGISLMLVTCAQQPKLVPPAGLAESDVAAVEYQCHQENMVPYSYSPPASTPPASPFLRGMAQAQGAKSGMVLDEEGYSLCLRARGWYQAH